MLIAHWGGSSTNRHGARPVLLLYAFGLALPGLLKGGVSAFSMGVEPLSERGKVGIRNPPPSLSVFLIHFFCLGQGDGEMAGVATQPAQAAIPPLDYGTLVQV